MDAADKDVAQVDMVPPAPKPVPPTNAVARFGERVFHVHSRGSTWLGEVRAGCVLFMTSAYILFLNPLILSGASNGFNTGMPRSDIVLATAISTAIATSTMGLVANYPWVVSVQLGTNSFFVNNVLGVAPCGHHATMRGSDKTCFDIPCTCVAGPEGRKIPNVILDGTCSANTTNTCMGTKIPYEQGLAATLLEGIVFLIICLTGLRAVFLRLFPKSVLLAGAAGIGVFIAFVGMKDSGFIIATPFPTLVGLNIDWPYKIGGWGASDYSTGIGFNSCTMYFDGPPFGPVCPWLSMGGLILTALLLVWGINGAFIMGIFFTMFIAWAKFPAKMSAGGLVPDQIIAPAKFIATAGAIDFNWGENTGALIGAFVMFLYLDFIGSSITFVSLGQMAGLLNKRGDMPRSNIAFLSDALGSMMGGLLGSSALTTYVESAAAMREGGRTGFTACVCSVLFLLSIVLWPLFSAIPAIATGPVLCLIGAVIFMSSIFDINWHDATDAVPAFTTIMAMPFTHNIAYGVIAGLAMHVIIKFFTFQLFKFQANWPGVALYKRWSSQEPMFTAVEGWNVDADGQKLAAVEAEDEDYSLITLVKSLRARKKGRTTASSGGPLPRDVSVPGPNPDAV